MEQFLFVYGTLRGEYNNPAARRVRAEATRIPQTTLAALDTYEAREYQRLRVPVHTSEGERIAWIYQYASEPPPEQRIPSGDFLLP